MKQMVDISSKKTTLRTAKVSCRFIANSQTIDAIADNKLNKGNALETAKIAGISAVKKTSENIVYAHPIKITSISFDFKIEKEAIEIKCTVKGLDQTGVEMEALGGAVTAALNIYDMTKSIDKSAKITELKLLEKTGGKSGDYVRDE